MINKLNNYSMPQHKLVAIHTSTICIVFLFNCRVSINYDADQKISEQTISYVKKVKQALQKRGHFCENGKIPV
jgi:hypothetical protein